MRAGLSDAQILRIVDAFELLEIQPTVDGRAIQVAFRGQAKKLHPDVMKTQHEKDLAHHRFIRLLKARDLALSFASEGVLSDILSAHEASAADGTSSNPAASGGRSPWGEHVSQEADDVPRHTASTQNPREDREPAPDSWTVPPRSTSAGQQASSTAYEDEWDVFVRDENAYFRLWESASTTLRVLAQTMSMTVLVTLRLSGIVIVGVPLVVIAGVLIVAATSATFAVPILGWIVGVLAAGLLFAWVESLWYSLEDFMNRTANHMLRTVARTGYPSRAYGFSAAVSVLLILSAGAAYVYFDAGVLAWILGIGLPVIAAISLTIIWKRVSLQMAALDAAFDRIRRSVSFGLVKSG